jgi:hypothetical protein
MIPYYYFNWTRSDVPWLSEQPQTGTIPPGGVHRVEVTLDVGLPEVDRAGNYYAALSVVANEPASAIHTLPVHLRVAAPTGLANLAGIVTGLERCDAPGQPLAGATLRLQSALDFSQDLVTDPAGAYHLSLDASYSPLTATISHPGYLTQTVTGLSLSPGLTTTQNIDLRLHTPCLQVTPLPLAVQVTLGHSQTFSLTLANTGAATLTFRLQLNEAEAATLEAAWLSATPSEGTVPPGGTGTILVEADASQGVGIGQHQALLQLESNDTLSASLSIPVVMNVVPLAVTITPLASTVSGYPGAILTHTLHLTNNSSTTQTFSLSASGNTWPILASLGPEPSALPGLIVGPLSPGAATTLHLLVIIPSDVAIGTTDTATLTLRSLQDGSPLATASLISTVATQAPGDQIYLPLLSR